MDGAGFLENLALNHIDLGAVSDGLTTLSASVGFYPVHLRSTGQLNIGIN
jgi:hypothetical protein